MRRASISLLVACAAGIGAILVSGCDIQAYCFADCAGGSATSVGVGGAVASSTGQFSTSSGFQGTGGAGCGDTQSSLENCGACGHACNLLGATPVCVMGECKIQACLPGQYDIDQISADGCEYACPVTDLTPEACDGIDNDCDSLVDAADPDLVPPPALCNQTPGTPCENTQVFCDSVEGWTCSYPAGVETSQGFIRLVETQCDGIDGNCDGSVDEWFTALGSSCHDNALGTCVDYGIVACDPVDPTKITCDLSVPPAPGVALPEACDGIDNDCNGIADDNLPDSAFAMVAIPGSSVIIDLYEASRPDASGALPGILENVACSKAGALPWSGGGFEEAATACTARGSKYRLCSATELEQACRGAANTSYPYADAYDGLACNGVDHNTAAALATGTLATCTSSQTPIYDLSGNLAEWTSTQTNSPAAPPNRIFVLAGGSYLSPKFGLACTIPLAPRAVETTLLPSIGFRCCKDP